MVPHSKLHLDAQLLHSGPVLGLPCEDMTSMAKIATAAAALRAAAPDEAIAALFVGWMQQGCSLLFLERKICRERDGNRMMG
jgi:hypothetical protein